MPTESCTLEAMVVAASTVSVGVALVVITAAVLLLAGALLALRKHNRMFPKGWDRTGWEPNSSKGWFATKVTWLSGGRGGL
jgi:hypothetical protein